MESIINFPLTIDFLCVIIPIVKAMKETVTSTEYKREGCRAGSILYRVLAKTTPELQGGK